MKHFHFQTRRNALKIWAAAAAIGFLSLASFFSSTAVAQKPGWKAEWERVKAAARKEGKLTLNIPANPILRRELVKVMKKKFGLELELFLANGGKSAPRIAAEYKAGIHYFDAAILSASRVAPALRPLGAVAPLEDYLILPEVTDPKNWWGGHIWGDKDKKYVYYNNAYMLDNIWYNTELVKRDEVKSWDDLLKPKWKGKIGLLDPRVTGPGRGIWAFILDVKGEEYLKKLIAQKPVLIGKYRPLVDQLVKGKIKITIGPPYQAFGQFLNAGLPVKPFPPMKEGTYVSVGNGGPVVMSKPPHPNATKVFVNWVLSREGQAFYSKAMGQATRRLDVDTKWMTKIGVRAAKDSLKVEDYYRMENQSEGKGGEKRYRGLKFARELLN